MTSRLSIANQALNLLGANSIDSLDEQVNEADTIKEHYDQVVRNILSRNAWSFATKKETFVRDTVNTPLNEYSYQFIRPNEALFIFRLFNGTAINQSPIQDYLLQEDYIFANDKDLYGEYAYYSDEAYWPGYFQELIVNALAAKIALPITDDLQQSNYYTNAAFGTPSSNNKGGLYYTAICADAKQNPPRAIINNPLLNARFGSINRQGF